MTTGFSKWLQMCEEVFFLQTELLITSLTDQRLKAQLVTFSAVFSVSNKILIINATDINSTTKVLFKPLHKLSV